MPAKRVGAGGGEPSSKRSNSYAINSDWLSDPTANGITRTQHRTFWVEQLPDDPEHVRCR